MAKTRQVPELRLMSYIHGGPTEQARFVDNLYSGLKDYGFIILEDHPIKDDDVQKAYDHVKEFFALPTETKERYSGVGDGGQRGYTPYKREHAKDHDFPDLKEFWHVGRELEPTHPAYNDYPPNTWPQEITGFKETMLSLYRAMDYTSEVLLEALAQRLDLPKTFFADMIKDGNSVLRCIHYPPVEGEDTANSVRAAAHGDINLITLLVGATDSGLELQDHDGSWLPVESSPGQIVVDTGDMMSRITNEVLPSTIHRVVNPDDASSSRYSMPFFVHPRSDAMLSCLPSCRGEREKYPDILAGDFLMQRLKEIGLMG